MDWENVRIYATDQGWNPLPIRFCSYLETLRGATLRYFYHLDPRSFYNGLKSREGQAIESLGFHVEERRAREDFYRKKVIPTRSGDLDALLIINAMDVLRKWGGSLKEVLLVSGDGHFVDLVKRIQEHRRESPIKVQVMCWSAITSAELKSQCDKFTPLEGMMDSIVHVPKPGETWAQMYPVRAALA